MTVKVLQMGRLCWQYLGFCPLQIIGYFLAGLAFGFHMFAFIDTPVQKELGLDGLQ